MSDVLQKIEDIAYPKIMAPFFGVMIPVKLKELTHAQISACGDFSLIETFQEKVDNISRKTSDTELIAQYEIMLNVVRESLVYPAYDDIIKIYDKDETIKKSKIELKEIKEILRTMKKGPQKAELEKQYNALRIKCEFMLPEDFIGFIWSHALGINKSDIQKLSEKILIEAAVLAEKGHDNPTDHLDGLWPEVQKGFYLNDINKKAWSLLYEDRERRGVNKKRKGLKIG